MEDRLARRHFITTADWKVEELEQLFQTAADFKERFKRGELTPVLQNLTLFMLFFEQSTRTRNSFEAGMTQLGGHAHDLTPDKMQISHGETPYDTGAVLSRYGHAIGIRNCFWKLGNRYIRDVARGASVPVFNLQCDWYHPCQAAADLMTVRERFGAEELRGRKFVVSWAYAPSYQKPLSVPQSLILLMPRFGMDVVLAHPPEFSLRPELLQQAQGLAKAAGTRFEIVHDMDAAFEGAHVVYPKSWGCMLHTEDLEESAAVAARYKSWICDDSRMALAASECAYMHCLPADRGHEVTDAVIDGSQSIVFDEAENRLHVQKALMALTMTGDKRGEY
ncbi:MAG: ornithine carbamoyltransferase [Candidatus Latescibacterota bacterium]|nr:MAG: ornithine carbamoyltransferase [Candidatus Latescibacterota bacterium]